MVGKWDSSHLLIIPYFLPCILASWRQKGHGVPKEGSENSKPVHGPLAPSSALYRDSE